MKWCPSFVVRDFLFFNKKGGVMKREHSINDFNAVDFPELSRRTAVHEAGHAAAVYFGNQQRALPPVFFQMVISPCVCSVADRRGVTRIEGGRLIHTLPSSWEEVSRDFSLAQQQTYRLAFEADVVNLLVGSLAEAKYVAERDNELINPHLVPLTVLHNYGGAADLEVVQEYLDCFVSKAEQAQKIETLFWQAFDFINDWTHWYAITALANYIVQHQRDVMDYDEVTRVLDTHFALAKKYSQRISTL
jgi:hypothetical protein